MLDESGAEVANMPMPYSHIVLAERISKEANLPLQDEAQYFVGAFYPDIRYFTKQPREKYHFAVEKLEQYELTDVSKDFLLGYKVHLLIDEVWEYPEIKTKYKEAFPSIIRSRMTRGLQALAFEMYCLEQPIKPIKLKTLENKLTRDLGVKPAETEFAVNAMQKYFDQHSLQSAYVMAEEAQLFPTERMKTVRQVLSLVNNPITGALVKGAISGASRQILPVVVEEVKTKLVMDKNVHEPLTRV
jgi:hypothetical protein